MAKRTLTAEETLRRSAEIRAELNRLVARPQFARAPKARRLIVHLVEAKLDGKPEMFSERAIAMAVFGLDQSYSPRANPVLRHTALRLRQALAACNDLTAASTRPHVELPRNSYEPRFVIYTPDRETSATRQRQDKAGRETRSTLPRDRPGSLRISGRASRLLLLVATLSAAVLAIAYLVFAAPMTEPPTTAGSPPAVSVWPANGQRLAD